MISATICTVTILNAQSSHLSWAPYPNIQYTLWYIQFHSQVTLNPNVTKWNLSSLLPNLFFSFMNGTIIHCSIKVRKLGVILNPSLWFIFPSLPSNRSSTVFDFLVFIQPYFHSVLITFEMGLCNCHLISFPHYF